MITEEQQKLQKKLGIKDETVVLTNLGADQYSGLVGIDSIRVTSEVSEQINFAHFFLTSFDDLIRTTKTLLPFLDKKGSLWLSWQKGLPGKQLGLDRDTIREFILETDLVDCKVCSVNEEWSALKFMFRLSSR